MTQVKTGAKAGLFSGDLSHHFDRIRRELQEKVKQARWKRNQAKLNTRRCGNGPATHCNTSEQIMMTEEEEEELVQRVALAEARSECEECGLDLNNPEVLQFFIDMEHEFMSEAVFAEFEELRLAELEALDEQIAVCAPGVQSDGGFLEE